MSIKSLIRLGRSETRLRDQHADASAAKPVPAHVLDSGYLADRCRFEIRCSCGAVHDTPYIDEALEWRELHLRLAPIADRLPV